MLPGAPAPSRAPARQLVIDLGLPRNVAPDVVEVPGVELLDLETISIHAPLEELGATDAARAIVGDDGPRFGAAREEHDLAPAVVALRKHVYDLLDGEIERARARGDDDGETEAALRHMAGVLLHTPMVRSRELARAGEQRRLDRRARRALRRAARRGRPGRARPSGEGCRRARAARRAGRRVVTDAPHEADRADRAAAAAADGPPALRFPFDATALTYAPIRTERLVLRPLEASDAADVFEYQRLPEVIRYLPWPERDRTEGYEHTAKRAADACSRPTRTSSCSP